MSELKVMGRPPKYDFGSLGVGDVQRHDGVSAQSLLMCAKHYVQKNGLGWKFRTITEDGVVILIRVS